MTSRSLMKKLLLPFIFGIGTLFFLAAPQKAQAGIRIPAPWRTGPAYYASPEGIFSIPEGVQAKWGEKEGIFIYKCHHFSLFWADVITFGCKPIAFTKSALKQSAQALDIAEDQFRLNMPQAILEKFEKEHPFSEMYKQNSGWFKYGRWVLLAILGAFVLLYILSSRPSPDGESSSTTPTS